MAQTKEGAIIIAAKKAGISVAKYIALTSNGLKKCTKCKLWKKTGNFYKDGSRFDGLTASCRNCKSQMIKPAKRKDGFDWCRKCQMLIQVEFIKNGLCFEHFRENERDRYANNSEFRFTRKNKTSQRRRNVDAVPPEGEEILLHSFNGLCAYCDKPATTFDHLTPVSKGGKTLPNNIVPACRSCNASKGTKDIYDWLEEKGINPKIELIDQLAHAEYWVY